MKRIASILLAAFFCLGVPKAVACTSFAVYSPKPLFGMNWDYPDTGAYLRLYQPDEYHQVFSFAFETEYGMGTNGSMNDQGLIAFVQDLHPREENTAAVGDTSVEDMHDYASFVPYVFNNAQDVQKDLSGKHIVNKYHTIHDLIADANGNAFVLEEAGDKNILTQAEDGVIVMTNFPNCQIGQFDMDKSETSLYYSYGFVGVDRYKAVHEVISGHRECFDVAHAFEALEKAAQAGLYRTRYSAVYDPMKMVVYVALERDYDHIWKISMKEETVETYLGFEKKQLRFSFAELCEGDLGIPFERLIAYAN